MSAGMYVLICVYVHKVVKSGASVCKSGILFVLGCGERTTYMLSMRVLEYATADAEKHTGTRRFPPVPRFGTSALYGMS